MTDLALAIRACARRIAALNKLCTQTKNQLHAAQLTATTPDLLIADLQQSITQLDAQILRQRVHDLIAPDGQLQHACDLLISVTGIADATPSNSSVNCWSCLTTGRPNNGSPWSALISANTSPAPASTKNRACPRPVTARQQPLLFPQRNDCLINLIYA